MGLAELLDATFSLYRRNVVLIAAITAVLSIPSAALQYAVLGGGANLTGSGTGHGALFAVVFAVDFLLIQPLIQAAVTRAVSDRYLERPATVRSSYSGALGRLRSLIAMSLELMLLAAALTFPVALVAVLSQSVVAAVILIGVAVVVALLVIVRLAFAAPAIVIEGLSGWGGIRRSWRLTRGSWWRVFGILLLVSLIVGAVQGTLVGFLSLPGLGLGGSARTALNAVATALVSVVVTPIRLIAVSLLYYDLRIRREAFDIEMLAASL